MPKRSLTPKQKLFTQEYTKDLNSTKAAIRAGYSRRTADRIGPELLGETWVAEAVQQALQKRSDKVELDAEWVLREFKEIYDRSMAHKPVLDRQGNTTGQWQYDGSNAIRALENIGKHVRFYPTEPQNASQTNVNVLVASPEWVKLRGVVIRALQPYPDAKAAVVEALREGDSDPM